MYQMGDHVNKFLLIFYNNLRPREKRYRFEILENLRKALRSVCIVQNLSNTKKIIQKICCFVITQILNNKYVAKNKKKFDHVTHVVHGLK